MTPSAPTVWSGIITRFTPRPATAQLRTSRFVDHVREQAASLATTSNTALRTATDQLRRRWPTSPASTVDDDILLQAFALINESCRRTLGIEFYDVQLTAGHALAQGRIAEMATGEGKTFVQALAAFSYALAGQGVHVMTSNAYLAQRDCAQLREVLEQLGMTVGLLQPGADPGVKRAAYDADITFGPGYEFGFDYLRDQLAQRALADDRLGGALHAILTGSEPAGRSTVQRSHAVAIIDEIDSVLIDEATTPLILSAGPSDNGVHDRAYRLATTTAQQLAAPADFTIDETERRIQLTRHGVQRVLAALRATPELTLQRAWPVYIEQALFASHFLKRDVDYVVDGGKVLLVDQSTGRVFADRTLRNGLHQAVESKEGITISPCRSTLGRISRQQYFQLYQRKCGMTGTATGSEREFWQLYQLAITRIPTRKPCQRRLEPTRFFATAKHKQAAIVEAVQRHVANNQPVLVGTRTIDSSEVLSAALADHGIAHQVLNGLQDATEAEVIAHAGQPSAVTVATNIAGRGTDIKLGPGVPEAGGLHVIVSEPHESTRVDRQLIGRCARQGDPGSCQTLVSADDQLLAQYGRKLARQVRRRAAADGCVASDLTPALRRVQQRVEQQHFEQRRNMLAHDHWMEDIMAKLVE